MIKALSLWDPWGTAMMLGLKKVETRGWYCGYRGPLVIHVALNESTLGKYMPPRLMKYFAGYPYGVTEPWPLGCVVCVVDVIDCVQTQILLPTLIQQEIDFGDYRQYGDDGKQRWGILTANRRVFPQPIRCRGHQGLWDWTWPFPAEVRP